jgi:hypothetical protein
MTDKIEFAELLGVEIFSVGRWKGSQEINVTSQMLDEMVASFDELSSKVPGYLPPCKLGHTEAQRFIGQGGSGAPALGWVSALVRVGDKLVADFKDVPSTLLDLIKRRLYNSVSVEIFPTVTYGGKTFKNVLGAVAILGAELPAVKGLKELSASLFDATATERVTLSEKEEDTMAGEATFTQTQVNGLIEVEVSKAATKFAADHQAALTAANDKVAAVEATAKADKERADRAEAALATFRDESAKQEVSALVDDAIKAGRVLPTEKDNMIALASSMTGTIKLAAGEKKSLDVFKDFLNKLPVKVEMSEKGAGGGDKKDHINASVEVDTKAKQKMAADTSGKMEYGMAVQAVLAEDPALKNRYAASL